jgi:hypothetical protein
MWACESEECKHFSVQGNTGFNCLNQKSELKSGKCTCCDSKPKEIEKIPFLPFQDFGTDPDHTRMTRNDSLMFCKINELIDAVNELGREVEGK